MYEIPERDIKEKGSITIYKVYDKWYGQYQIKDEEVLAKINEVWV